MERSQYLKLHYAPSFIKIRSSKSGVHVLVSVPSARAFNTIERFLKAEKACRWNKPNLKLQKETRFHDYLTETFSKKYKFRSDESILLFCWTFVILSVSKHFGKITGHYCILLNLYLHMKQSIRKWCLATRLFRCLVEIVHFNTFLLLDC